MKKKITTFLILTFCTASILLAQPILPEQLFKKYTATSPSHLGNPYCLVELKSNTPQKIKDAFSLDALRKFSENLYLIDSSSIITLSLNHLYIKKIEATNNYWKLSSSAETLLNNKNKSAEKFHFQILCRNLAFTKQLLRSHKELNNHILLLRGQNIISVVCSIVEMQNIFLNETAVIFIDLITSKPTEELGTPGFDLSANKINMVHSKYPSIRGQGKQVSIKEDFYDTTDIDMKGRYKPSPLASVNSTNHANFMATIIAGAGNAAFYSRGVAEEAFISSSSFEQVLPDADSVYVQSNITVQNHSYGTDIENNYGIGAMAFDKNSNNNQALLHVFSAGNVGNKTSATGNYAGIEGFANLTGNFKMAKNVLVAGAVDSFGNMAPLSSRGPAYDGRIKPDLVAFQKNGTSEAAALVSGTALLLQQYYSSLHPHTVLPSALAKAILINSADDIGAPGPDFKTGFGNLNALKAMNLLRDNTLFAGNIMQDSTQTIPITIPENIALLKITLAWNDTAALPMANKALVNDVDLEVSLPAHNLSWLPWVLNPNPHIDSLNSIAVRKKDSLNNIEQVTIENPVPGNYELKIKGYHLPTGNQKYQVVYSMDTLNKFIWQAPDATDLVQAGTQTILRWQSTYKQSGRIEYSISPNQWQLITDSTAQQKNYFYWQVPDTISQALLRIKIGNDYFYSDTITITTLLKPGTGYICGDSVLIFWNKLKGINRYQIYQLGDQFMEPLFTGTDTTAIIAKTILKDKYLAVAPILNNGIKAFRSYAFNYTTQGAGCFINSFYAAKNDAAAQLNLLLGTVINVSSISFEKQAGSVYVSINNPTLTNQLQYNFKVDVLQEGINYFRAKIVLANGLIIYSKPEAVYYAASGKYILLPVPVLRNNNITLITSIPNGEVITLTDVLGRIVLTQPIQSIREVISTSLLQGGEYFYRIHKKGMVVGSGKLIIL